MLHITEATPLPSRRLQIAFDNGEQGIVDLSQELTGPVFSPLQGIDLFKQVKVHSLFHTIIWPNGADLAPEFLLDLLRNQQGHAA